ncbi:unnamed protein product [Victoria cruziana]
MPGSRVTSLRCPPCQQTPQRRHQGAKRCQQPPRLWRRPPPSSPCLQGRVKVASPAAQGAGGLLCQRRPAKSDQAVLAGMAASPLDAPACRPSLGTAQEAATKSQTKLFHHHGSACFAWMLPSRVDEVRGYSKRAMILL